MFQFGEADGQLVAALKQREAACEVVQPELGPRGGDEPTGPLGADPGTLWIDSHLNDEVIKRYRPYNKAVGVFATRGLALRDAKELLGAVRHGLPASGELHLIEFAAPKSAEVTVAGLLRMSGFKIVERTSSVPSLTGLIELYRAQKQSPDHTGQGSDAHM